ncbi:DNA alkylation repair protein [Glaciihabitans sp. dw_435]|uniref:DNA alkylation repair protein n=1 Tax=Glaciihabitans sp. dw_435 TaxID=2720081 RepID=UPI001BD30CCC|nr:DNA alkylation repair protein [Glaciihabitans sp. dw_435]
MGTMNELLNAAAVHRLAAHIATVSPGTDLSHLRATSAGVDGLNLRARSDLISDALVADLPGDYATVAALFRRALAIDDVTGWIIWPVSETVTTLALADGTDAAFDDALALLSELTGRLTAEFAIRRLLERDLDRALAVIVGWTSSPDEHVRRLASEGTRAFLPWAIRVRSLLAHPESTIPILDALYRDESEYVRRSVANHLNDLSRENPDFVAAVAERWMTRADAATARLVRHALRSLIKKGHPATLALLGFGVVELRVSPVVLTAGTVLAPGDLEFAVDIVNEGATASKLAVDYVIYYLKSNGSQAQKVFKLAATTLAPGEALRATRRHSFRSMTTRVHYPGAHSIELQINGQRYAKADFLLEM